MKVRDLMTPDPHTLPIDATLGDAVEAMVRHRVRHLPVVDDGRIAGIISDRDVKMCLGPDAAHLDLDAIDPRQADGSVDWFMTEDVVSVSPDASIADVGQVFLEAKLGALPVVDGDRVVGIISVLDIVRAALPLLRDA